MSGVSEQLLQKPHNVKGKRRRPSRPATWEELHAKGQVMRPSPFRQGPPQSLAKLMVLLSQWSFILETLTCSPHRVPTPLHPLALT